MWVLRLTSSLLSPPSLLLSLVSLPSVSLATRRSQALPHINPTLYYDIANIRSTICPALLFGWPVTPPFTWLVPLLGLLVC
ncbi:hypothetical protein BDR22DRAFT_471493 [Usnea florida]